MFSGIVTAVGSVAEVRRGQDRLAFRVEAPYQDLVEGESVSVSGACLTVVACGSGWFEVEAIVTTRSRTWFGDLEAGDRVNLERSLAIGDRLGGHFVQGHVDGVGTVTRVVAEADAVLIDVDLPDELAELSVPHGSIAIEGVSLTINEIPRRGAVQVALIPYTLEHTTLGSLREGDPVHLEGDMIGKFVRQLLRARQGDVVEGESA